MCTWREHIQCQTQTLYDSFLCIQMHYVWFCTHSDTSEIGSVWIGFWSSKIKYGTKRRDKRKSEREKRRHTGTHTHTTALHLTSPHYSNNTHWRFSCLRWLRIFLSIVRLFLSNWCICCVMEKTIKDTLIRIYIYIYTHSNGVLNVIWQNKRCRLLLWNSQHQTPTYETFSTVERLTSKSL